MVNQATEVGLKYTVRTGLTILEDGLGSLWPISWLKLRASCLTETGAHTELKNSNPGPTSFSNKPDCAIILFS